MTVSGLDPGTTYYFWIVNKAGTDSKTSNTVSGETKAQIAAFAWTSDDGAYIAAGKAVTYLTAASWNRLTAKHGIGRDEAGSDVLCKQLFCAQGSAQPGNQQL